MIEAVLRFYLFVIL